MSTPIVPPTAAGTLVLDPALAAAGAAAEVPVSAETPGAEMLVGLFGGLALFLYGLEKLTDALQEAAGEKLKVLLGKLTANRFLGVLTGAFVTAVIQSSSVTTVLVVGFISAGLMSLQQSVGVIMGANLGTTITAQLVAFRLEEGALLMVAVGYALKYLMKRDWLRPLGGVLMGLGLIFFGMGVMSEAMEPLRSYTPFIQLMARMENPLFGLLMGALFTALVQSSSATTGVVITLASQGLCTLEAGIALTLGANVGTCVTAALASIGKPTEAKRAAMVHVLFNVLGVLIWIGLIPTLAAAVVGLSPSHPELDGLARVAREVPRQLANANTLFNLANTVLFLGFAGSFAAAASWLVPPEGRGRARRGHLDRGEALYLSPDVLETPALALEMVRLELGRVSELIDGGLGRLGSVVENRDLEGLDGVRALENQVDHLHERISDYLVVIREGRLTVDQSVGVQHLLEVADNLEYVADVLAKDLVPAFRQSIELGFSDNESCRILWGPFLETARRALRTSVRAFQGRDVEAAERVGELRGEIRGLVERVFEAQAKYLDVERDGPPIAFRVEMQLVDDLRRIYTLAKRIARLETR